MANHKSAAKRARQTEKKNARNSRTKKTIRTIEKKLRTAISSKNTDEANSFLREFATKIDKAAQKGILHVNNASRKVGRLAKQVGALSK